MSFEITSTINEVSSSTIAVSETATGASFTAVTVIVNVPVEVSVPSDTI